MFSFVEQMHSREVQWILESTLYNKSPTKIMETEKIRQFKSELRSYYNTHFTL
jgi:hypothetical protein